MNWIKDVASAAGKAWDAGTKAAEKTLDQAGKTLNDVADGAAQSLDEFTSGMNKELDDVGKAAKEGNFFGAAAELMELGNIGQMGSEAIAALGGPKDPVVKELVSGAINFAGGNVLGVVKDMADAFGALSAGASETGRPSEPHTCERPTSAAARKARAKAKAKAAAKEKAALKMENARLRNEIERLREKLGDGYGPSNLGGGGSVAEQLEQVMKQIKAIIMQLQTKPGAVNDRFRGNAGWLEGKRGNSDSEVSKLGPNATFEDLVAAFMMDVIKEKQKQVQDMMQQMKDLNTEKQLYKAMDKVEKAANKAGGAVLALAGPLGSAAGAVTEMMQGGAEGRVDSIENSRQMLFEKLKNEMNKLQEMMQSLSNVLNAMHQGAMNSIRNIK